jgi:hypothetical protein
MREGKEEKEDEHRGASSAVYILDPMIDEAWTAMLYNDALTVREATAPELREHQPTCMACVYGYINNNDDTT